MAVPVWRGKIRRGSTGQVVNLHNKRQYDLFINAFEEGVEVEVTVKKYRSNNSRKQQNYYRGVLIPYIAREIGQSNEMTHSQLQLKFFIYKTESGTEYIRTTSLGAWKAGEWEAKMDEIRNWAYDFLNLIIPLPNEVEL